MTSRAVRAIWCGSITISRPRRFRRLSQAWRAATSLALALTLLAIGLASALGVSLSRAIMRGISALAAGTAAVAGGDLNYRVVVRGADELSTWPARSIE